MGYMTYFSGEFKLNKPLEHNHMEYLLAFKGTRRMKRRAIDTVAMPDIKREAVGLTVGKEGGYFVGNEHSLGQVCSADVLDYNSPPDGQPGLWCQWEPNEAGTAIVWDGGEKFYDYVKWIEYLIEHFLKPWGYVLSGEVEWIGEDPDDRGKIICRNNAVTTKRALITYQ